jgi:transcriptional regulator with XRE-family HTH domain
MTSKELVDLRVGLGIDQSEFARLLGYWTEFYTALEAGDLPMTPAIAERVHAVAALVPEGWGQRPHEDL